MSQQPTGWQAPTQWPAPQGQPWGGEGAGSLQAVHGAGQRTATQPVVPLWREVVAAIIVLALALGAAGAWIVDGATPSNRSTPITRHPLPQVQRPAQNPTSTHQVTVTPDLSVGVVLVWGELTDSESAGSGIVLTDSGLVLTNYHVVADTFALTVEVPTTGDTYDATVVGRNMWADVALLQLAGASGLQPAAIDHDGLAVGDQVTAVGNADGGGVLVGSGGSVTSVDASVTLPSNFGMYGTDTLSGLIRSTAGAIPGYSGGPTFDSDAEVVGMTSAGRTRVSNDMTTFSIPIGSALEIVDDIVAGHETEHTRIGPAAWLGVSLGAADRPAVTYVQPGSPAEVAGLSPGSTITAFGGIAVETANALLRLVESTDPGDRVDLEWTDEAGIAQAAPVVLGTSSTN
ncbi:hypothetical protein GCM10009785_21430 [Brooklawnia cerclae]|uniref:S1-C subfamily serine protease n=1 Tax=Brooklawnia cerclae TaxID=349934 RepID=A0ABX0SIK7_9ACTN|nr:trypsin-like peptidase domain-containing protein [Brooklawnia cerclae]NIH58232.1 S1-C subfamily serine protease [Brooklawnia cerclae]